MPSVTSTDGCCGGTELGSSDTLGESKTVIGPSGLEDDNSGSTGRRGQEIVAGDPTRYKNMLMEAGLSFVL